MICSNMDGHKKKICDVNSGQYRRKKKQNKIDENIICEYRKKIELTIFFCFFWARLVVRKSNLITIMMMVILRR